VMIDEAASEAEEAAAEISDRAVHARCIKQLAQTANRKPKCLLYHPVTDLCIAGIATRNINHRDIDQSLTLISVAKLERAMLSLIMLFQSFFALEN